VNRNGQGARAGPGGAITRSILWSAAGHVLALSACLALGTGRGPDARLLPVVEVLLVAGDAGPGAPVSSGTARAAPLRRATGSPPAPGVPAGPAPRPGERPSFAAATGPKPLPPAARATASAASTPGPAQRPAETAPPARVEVDLTPRASGAGAAVPAGAEAPGPDAGTGFSVPWPAPGGAPAMPAIAPAGGGAGRGGTGIAGPGPSAYAGDGDAGGGRGGATVLLRERIQSRIVYPDEAVRRGLEGEVLLRIHIATGGVPNEIRVARSSGARLLDDAARRGVVRAAPLPSAPGWVEVPVRFHLQ